jgi:hypothetical protein
VEVVASGSRDGKPFQATQLFRSSLRTTPAAMLQLVRDRWSIEGWHWIRDGHAAHGSSQLAQAGRVSVNPCQHAGNDARHYGPAGDGQATAAAQPMLKL